MIRKPSDFLNRPSIGNGSANEAVVDSKRFRYHPSAMVTALSFLLLALLCVALPFHAAYGVGMVQSMALGNGDVQRAQGASAHPSHAHSTGAHAKHADQDGAGHAHHGPDDDAPQTDPGSHCGTCTACCTSLGMTGALLGLPAALNFGERIAFGERRLLSLATVPLERPPLFL